MADPNETLVPFHFGDITIAVSAFDALMLSSDLFLTGEAYVVADEHRYRRIRPEHVRDSGADVKRIEKARWSIQS